MSFKCQMSPYLKEFLTNVKSCQPAKRELIIDGKKKTCEGYDVILDDTILFPEGGGQPSDKGLLDGLPVLDVRRVGAEAVHFLSSSVTEGAEVKLELDWDRRFDHMQQHTAQHLVTAITDSLFGYQTTSWDIGVFPRPVCIELNTPSMTANQQTQVTAAVNEALRRGVDVTPTLYTDKNDPELVKFRGLGLPDDHCGPVRVCTIEDIDAALCCGTHVSSLNHIQAVQIVGVEKGKKGKTNMMFLAGNRLLNYVENSYQREKQLTGILKGPGPKHCELAEKAVKSCKSMQKMVTTQSRELASLEAKLFSLSCPQSSFFAKHKKDADNDYINVLIAELGEKVPVKLVTAGADSKEADGQFVLAGPSELLSALGDKVSEALCGRGAAGKGSYRGKAAKPASGLAKAEAIIQEYLRAKEEGNKEVSDNAKDASCGNSFQS